MFRVGRFIEKRPFLYHVTSPLNLDRIRKSRRLESAEQLYRAGDQVLPPEARRSTVDLQIGNVPVRIRDQKGIVEGNIEWYGGWGMRELLDDLNRRVFFWADVKSVAKHLRTYEAERPSLVILRVPAQELVRMRFLSSDDPEDPLPWFSRYNSGFPRWNPNGKDGEAEASPRGPKTFVLASKADFTLKDVKEVTFVGEIALPEGCAVAREACRFLQKDETCWEPL